MIPDIVSQLTADTAYSPENFKWLMDHSSARSYLGPETVARIFHAMQEGDDVILQEYYALILQEYLKEKRIDEDFSVTEGVILGNFNNEMDTMGKNLKKVRKDRNNKEEQDEKEGAESILDQIKFTN